MMKPSSSLHIKLWGVRGSLPSPHTPLEVSERTRSILENFLNQGFKTKEEIPKFLSSLSTEDLSGFGGNTLCVEIQSKTTRLIIDGGTGIRPLGYDLLRGPCGSGQGQIHVFMTHFHWDHIIGLPFFTPIFIPKNQIHFYAVQPELPQMIETVFKKPYFPVELRDLAAELHFHRLEARVPFQLGDLTITPYLLDHPDPCWGYKVQHGDKTYSHCVDTEARRTSRDELGADLPLYQGVDVMLFDAQYSLKEAVEKMNWGHSAATIGLDLAMREKIKRVFFCHHDPASSDQKIAAAQSQARRYYQEKMKQDQSGLCAVDWSYAREGMIVEI